MTEFTGYTGELAQDSPALAQALRRASFSQLERSWLADLYTLTAIHGGLEEPELRREPGVRYNPRPARLCQLLLQEGKVRQAEELAAAILLCSDRELDCRSPSAQTRSASSLRQEVRGVLTSKNAARASLPGQRIALASALDTSRHLHMRELDDAERQRQIQDVDQIMRTVSPDLSQDRLTILLSSLLERLSR